MIDFNITINELMGWLAATCFCLCGLPQVIQCYKTKTASGISWMFLILWLSGELFGIAYIFPRQDVPLMVNYSISTVFILIILYYKIKDHL